MFRHTLTSGMLQPCSPLAANQPNPVSIYTVDGSVRPGKRLAPEGGSIGGHAREKPDRRSEHSAATLHVLVPAKSMIDS